MSFIEIKNLSKKINNTNILKNINLSFNLNEFICIIGKSGAGKTTLLNSIGLIDKNINGSIKINNLIITKKNIDKIRKSFLVSFSRIMGSFHILLHEKILNNI